MPKAIVDVTDRNGRKLEQRSISEESDVAALVAQNRIYAEARARYGADCYVFTNWDAAPGTHIPGSPADLDARSRHQPFPEERA